MKKKYIAAVLTVMAVMMLALTSGCEKANELKLITSIEELERAEIGVETGSIFGQILEKVLPDCKPTYFYTPLDAIAAMDSGKVSAVICNRSYAEIMIRNGKAISVLCQVGDDNYGFAFRKNNEKSDALRAEFNEYIAFAKKNGILNELQDIWFGVDEEKKNCEYVTAPGVNGVIHLGVAVDGSDPFVYMKDGKFVGYDVDLMRRFCASYGYSLEITNYEFSGLLSAVEGGKEDLAGSGLSITPERLESLNFSDPVYSSPIVLTVRAPKPIYSSIEELTGKRAALLSSAIFDTYAEKYIPGTVIDYYDTNSDIALAVKTGKADYFITDDPIAKVLCAQHSDLSIFAYLAEDHYGMIFPKTEDGALLRDQFNVFLKEIKADGSYDEIVTAWLGKDAEKQTVNYESLPATNGTLTLWVSTNVGVPCCYIKNGKYAGYEISLATAFCRRYGYGLKIEDSNFGGILSAVEAGKADMGAAAISITEERMEKMNFSEPTYDGGVAVVVKNDIGGTANKKTFFESIADSFEKTFIRENRWKLFVDGILMTLLVTCVSAVAGTLIGFGIYLIYRKKNKAFVIITDALGFILEKLPVVVILMILYYVIFGSIDINNAFVAMIGFTVLFTFNVLELIKGGVSAIDAGQTEAALALGYTDSKAFLKMIFPQATRHFMPGYKSSIVSLTKETSIVGYIAVQDLTKISDIIRSRTYEAFFPLIATAVIYFLLSLLLIFIVRRIEFGTDTRKRKPKRILKGIEKK